MVDFHFSTWSTPRHDGRAGMEQALLACDSLNLMVETGTSAWGCDSSRLLDLVAKKFGNTFVSVDIRAEASMWLKFQTSNHSLFFVQDSLEFFRESFPKNFNRNIDFAYLDSFDLDFRNPEPSESHGLQEFESVCRYSRKGTIVLIDDTPAELDEVPEAFRHYAKQFQEVNNRLPGKGSLVLKKIQKNGNFEVLWHSYNLVVRILRANPLLNDSQT